MVELLVEVKEDLLSETVVHAEHVVQDLHWGDRKAQEGLREQFLEVARLGREGRLEILVSWKQDRSYHLYDSEYLCILNDKEYVISDFVGFLVHGTIYCVHWDQIGEGF